MYWLRPLLGLSVLTGALWIPVGAHDPPRPPPGAERPTGVALASLPPSDLSSSLLGGRSILALKASTRPGDPPISSSPAPKADSRPVVAAAVAPAPRPTMPNASIWACIRQHESGDNYAENTGNGYYGAYQFLIGTWDSIASRYNSALIGVRPDLATPAEQDQMAIWTQQTSGWGQWATAAGCGAYG